MARAMALGEVRLRTRYSMADIPDTIVHVTKWGTEGMRRDADHVPDRLSGPSKFGNNRKKSEKARPGNIRTHLLVSQRCQRGMTPSMN